MKLAINGFGRIGRMVLRAALKNGSFGNAFDLVAINSTDDPKLSLHLLKYDTVHGRLSEDAKLEGNYLVLKGKKIALLNERDPARLPWKSLGVELVLECTGAFTEKDKAAAHISAGAKKVLISAPGKGVEATLVLGVNDFAYDPKKHSIISMASCTTNCLAPVAMVLDEKFGIESGFMTTVHAYTNDQRMLDVGHKDYRRARAAAVNIIPTTTGAAKAIGEVLPKLKGKLDGLALRVPVPDGSMNDLTVELSKDVTKEQVNAALRDAAQGKLKGILEYTEEPIVSSDIIGNPHSAIVDGLCTSVVGKRHVKVLSWYDNEWGYSNRLAELAARM